MELVESGRHRAGGLDCVLQALGIGFYLDDWGYVERVGRMGPAEFILRSFNPLDPAFLYTFRPFHGMLTAGTYALFGANPVAYHTVHITLHLLNAWLLYIIVAQIAPGRRIAFLSALIYATLPVFSFAVFLISAINIFFDSVLPSGDFVLVDLLAPRQHTIFHFDGCRVRPRIVGERIGGASADHVVLD